LIENQGQIVEKKELISKVWGITISVTDGALDFQINRLRKALGDDSANPQYIKTIKRRGIQFIATVTIVKDEILESVPAQEKESAVEETPSHPEIQQAAQAVKAKSSSKRWVWMAGILFGAVVLAGIIKSMQQSPQAPGARFRLDKLALSAQPTPAPEGKLLLSIRIEGQGFDRNTVQVLVVGPGCPRPSNCIVPNSVLGDVTETSIEGVPLTLTAGDFQILVRNGAEGQLSNGLPITVP
jgi:DNA-binding winged helix-turn-helix (wHTH) protein